jgi:hypothetical protein
MSAGHILNQLRRDNTEHTERQKHFERFSGFALNFENLSRRITMADGDKPCLLKAVVPK